MKVRFLQAVSVIGIGVYAANDPADIPDGIAKSLIEGNLCTEDDGVLKPDAGSQMTIQSDPVAAGEQTDAPTLINGSLADADALESLGLDEKTIKLLRAGEVLTVTDARKFLAEHASFEPLKGIGEGTSAKIIAALG